jgi:hypothetical protein
MKSLSVTVYTAVSSRTVPSAIVTATTREPAGFD